MDAPVEGDERPPGEEFLNEEVEIIGLVTSARHNGRKGIAYEFDVARGRYKVLVEGQHLAVRPLPSPRMPD